MLYAPDGLVLVSIDHGPKLVVLFAKLLKSCVFGSDCLPVLKVLFLGLLNLLLQPLVVGLDFLKFAIRQDQFVGQELVIVH